MINRWTNEQFWNSQRLNLFFFFKKIFWERKGSQKVKIQYDILIKKKKKINTDNWEKNPSNLVFEKRIFVLPRTDSKVLSTELNLRLQIPIIYSEFARQIKNISIISIQNQNYNTETTALKIQGQHIT